MNEDGPDPGNKTAPAIDVEANVICHGAYFWFWHECRWKLGHMPEGSMGFIETWDETIDGADLSWDTPAIAVPKPEPL